MTEIKTFLHTRKGEVKAEIIKEHGEWVDVKLVVHQNAGIDGEIVTLRKAFIKNWE